MAPSFEAILAQYDYTLPPELIAQEPASPRDSAGLVVYDRKTGSTDWSTFANIGGYLTQGSALKK
jgi:S-adenosylmethionine:tRNA ribosyltransferase-isomerase